MVIKNAKVYTEDFQFQERDICVEQGVFTETASEQNIVYADDLYAIPGLIDIHLHGAVGQDFSDGTVKAVEKLQSTKHSMGLPLLCQPPCPCR